MQSNIALVACLLLCSACGRKDLGLITVETTPSVIVITEGVVATNSGGLHLQHRPLTVEQGELTPDMLQANGLLVSDGHAAFSSDTELPQYYRCYLHKVHYPTNMTPNQVYRYKKTVALWEFEPTKKTGRPSNMRMHRSQLPAP